MLSFSSSSLVHGSIILPRLSKKEKKVSANLAQPVNRGALSATTPTAGKTMN